MPPADARPPAAKSRQDRLAEALRENLKRRKVQARGRDAAEQETAEQGDDAEPPATSIP